VPSAVAFSVVAGSAARGEFVVSWVTA